MTSPVTNYFVLSYGSTARARGVTPDGCMWMVVAMPSRDLLGYAIDWRAENVHVTAVRLAGKVSVYADAYEVNHDKLSIRFYNSARTDAPALPTDAHAPEEGAAQP